jgi:putative polyhydroxyalkanoate system protein
MANNLLTLSVPHQLSRDEARRRIRDQLDRLQQQPYGGMVSRVEQRWSGDTLDFTVHAAGQAVTGQLFVEDHAVRVEVALPWMLALLANTFKQQIERQGRDLLGHRG